MCIRDRREYEVRSFSRASELYALLETESFDVVLCDVLLHETSGLRVFEEVRRRRPEVARRFVFFSGGGLPPALDFLRQPFLEKPCSLSSVRSVIKGLLESEASHEERSSHRGGLERGDSANDDGFVERDEGVVERNNGRSPAG